MSRDIGAYKSKYLSIRKYLNGKSANTNLQPVYLLNFSVISSKCPVCRSDPNLETQVVSMMFHSFIHLRFLNSHHCSIQTFSSFLLI